MGAAPECPSSKGGDDGGARLLGALGDSKRWPPGFRFHPTDEELVLYYLKRKICRRRIRLPMIGDLDVYKWEPWELPDKSVLRSGDKQWYFFSSRDRKYPNGSRSNRTTMCGYWKATGKDRTISQNSRAVGYKKTLVYHQGRAPKGQRTDWVMYEFTLDEQVLMNCKNVQDSYALYKVFQKSGPGPKNGEQYGAPFREEEWNEDIDEPDDEGMKIQDNGVDAVSDNHPSGSTATMLDNDTNDTLVDDLDVLLRQFTSDQVVNQPHLEFPTYAPEVEVESEVGNLILGQSYFEASSTWCEQDIDLSFYLPQSASTDKQPIEKPEVTSLTNCSKQDQLVMGDDFLEIKDFIDPEPPVLSMDNVGQKDYIDDANEFYDPCDYFDPNMVLAEAMGSLDPTAPQSYFDGFNIDETQNQMSHISNELWTYEQPFNMSSIMGSDQAVMASPASTSGAIYDNNLPKLGGDSRGQISHAGSASESWFNSALSALLETIPSRPAIASENALINRALERVSSFRAGQIGARQQNNTTTEVGTVAGRRQGGHNGGFLFISFLVGLGAILWVLTIGAAVKVVKSLWGRFATS